LHKSKSEIEQLGHSELTGWAAMFEIKAEEAANNSS